MNTPINRSSKNSAAGFTLVELAVAVLILAIGALGLAGLQISAKRAGFEAVQRTQAAALATDLFERMRVNPSDLTLYQTAGVGAATGSSLSTPAKNCVSSTCVASELATQDMWQWEQAIDGANATRSGVNTGGLLNAIGCVTVTGRRVTIEIAWQGAELLSDPNSGSGCGTGLYGTDDADRQILQMTSMIGTI
ncbi:type IV pilus modification protein PilV [Parahaliea maris]|uniref:Type IV pilus modification protein PilV n=1 Tax=Parahaliea maris TaxID=2716870 RepID=A0A5C8ZSD6_9GAMM|nr:type IV pilus modification protein PilV [Parahaliea maris]TXS91366.1 type IV pilus modification protein PilV [Parahaliea maris]